MARLSEEQIQRLAAAVSAGEAIPHDVFLASRGDSAAFTQAPAPVGAGLQECKTAGDEATLYSSDEYRLLVRAVERWRGVRDGKECPDLHGKAAKTVGTILEKEIKQAVEAELGRDLGGNSGNGVDILGLNLDVKTTFEGHPQGGLPQTTGLELFYGVSHHLLVVVYRFDLAGGTPRMRIQSVSFVPQWRTGDHRASLDAEAARQRVQAGANPWDEASGLLERWGLRSSGELLEISATRLASTDPVPAGTLTLTRVDSWRVNYNRVAARSTGSALPLAPVTSLPVLASSVHRTHPEGAVEQAAREAYTRVCEKQRNCTD